MKSVIIKRVEVERFSVTSSKPFETVVAALETAVGKSKTFFENLRAH
jgi:hypothetical protein